MDDNLPQQPKSSRTYEEWRASLLKIIKAKLSKVVEVDDEFDKRVKPYYDQALMPDVCFNELFNH